MQYELMFLEALLFTIFAESVVLFLVVRNVFKISKQKISNTLLLFLGVFCSFATLPYLWFVLPFFVKDYILYVIFGELIVLFLEAVIYYSVLKLKLGNALIVSFLCNAVSFLLGLIVF